MHAIARVGLIGIGVFVLLNGFAALVLGKEAAQPFSSAWWSEWFPAVLVFLVLFCAGAALSLGGRSPAGDCEERSRTR